MSTHAPSQPSPASNAASRTTPKTPAELRPQFAALCRALSLDPGLIAVLGHITVEDLHDLLEVRAIDAHNARVIRKNAAERDKEQ